MHTLPLMLLIHRMTSACATMSHVQGELRANELMKMGINVRILTVGKKGNVYFKRRANKYDLAGERLLPKICNRGSTKRLA